MSITEKRKYLRNYINKVDERFLNAMFAMLKSYIDGTTSDFELTVQQKSELDKRMARHKKGESKSYTFEEVKQRARSQS